VKKLLSAVLGVLMVFLLVMQVSTSAQATEPPPRDEFNSLAELELVLKAADLPEDEFNAYMEQLKENGVYLYSYTKSWVAEIKTILQEVGYPVVEDESRIESFNMIYYPSFGHVDCVYDIIYKIGNVRYRIWSFPFEGRYDDHTADKYMMTADIGGYPMQLYRRIRQHPTGSYDMVSLRGQWRVGDYLITVQADGGTNPDRYAFIEEMSLAPFQWSREITPTAPDYRLIKALYIGAGTVILLAGAAVAWLLIRRRKRQARQET